MAPEAISSTFRSDSAIASPRARPSRRLSSVSAVWQTPMRDPPLVGQPVAEELPEVRGGVEDRQVVVFDRGDPGAVLGALPAIRWASSGSPGKS